MNHSLLLTLFYILIAVLWIAGGLYQSRQKKSRSGRNSPSTQLPKDILGEPGRDFQPDFGPFSDIFGIPRNPAPAIPGEARQIQTREEIHPENSSIPEDMSQDARSGDSVLSKEEAVTTQYEEGQSDLQKMISHYEAIARDFSEEETQDEIAASEIVSPEEEDYSMETSDTAGSTFDARKAIIYSEILKRKEI